MIAGLAGISLLYLSMLERANAMEITPTEITQPGGPVWRFVEDRSLNAMRLAGVDEH